MKGEVEEIIRKAERSLEAALTLFEGNNFDFAVSRA